MDIGLILCQIPGAFQIKYEHLNILISTVGKCHQFIRKDPKLLKRFIYFNGAIVINWGM